MRTAVAAALVLVAAGCAGTAGTPPPPPAAAADLRGTWTGTWGGTPLTLLITDQTDSAPYSGLYLGPWLISGQRYPGVAGIMTYTVGGQARSTRFDGWISSSHPLVLRVLSAPPDGLQALSLRSEGQDRLTGDGESTFRWGPQGAVELTRRAGPRPS